MQTIIDSVLANLYPTIAAILTAGIVYLGNLVRGWIEQKTKAGKLQDIMLRLNDAVFTSVKAIQQVFVDNLKPGPDGKIDAGQLAKAKQDALALVKSHLGLKGIEDILKILGFDSSALDMFLNSKIESAVHDLKSSNPVNP